MWAVRPHFCMHVCNAAMPSWSSCLLASSCIFDFVIPRSNIYTGDSVQFPLLALLISSCFLETQAKSVIFVIAQTQPFSTHPLQSTNSHQRSIKNLSSISFTHPCISCLVKDLNAYAVTLGTGPTQGPGHALGKYAPKTALTISEPWSRTTKTRLMNWQTKDNMHKGRIDKVAFRLIFSMISWINWINSVVNSWDNGIRTWMMRLACIGNTIIRIIECWMWRMLGGKKGHSDVRQEMNG